MTGGRDGHVTVASAGGDELTVAARAIPPLPGSRVQIGIRPEVLTPADRGVLSGAVRIVEYLDGLTMVHVARHAEEPIVVQLPGGFRADIGETVRSTPRPPAYICSTTAAFGWPEACHDLLHRGCRGAGLFARLPAPLAFPRAFPRPHQQ